MKSSLPPSASEPVEVDTARARVRFVVDSIENGEALAPECADLVICCNVLRVPEKAVWRNALASTMRWLKPGGVLVIEHQNAIALADEVHQLLREAGFELLSDSSPFPNPDDPLPERNPTLKYVIDLWPTG